MSERTKTHITALIDRSGSMQSIKSDVVGGINSYMEEQAKEEGKCKVTVIQFDSENPHDVMRDCKLGDWKPIMEQEFQPRAATPLRDAMARAINAVERKPKTQEIFLVMTDGMENASTEITSEALQALVKERTEQDEWVFVYLGANQDAINAAGSTGMSMANAQNFVADGSGIAMAMASAGGMTRGVRSMRRRGKSVDVSNVYASTGVDKSADEDADART